MINKSRIQKGVETFLIVFTLIYSGFPLQAQNQLDKKFKKDADSLYDMLYKLPKNYHGIAVQGFYIANKNNLQSDLEYGIKNEKHKIVIAFALVKSVPTNTPRGKRIREVSGNPGKINEGVIALEADNVLAKVKYLDTLHLNKVKADSGVIYNMKISTKYMRIYARCKKIVLYKSEWGRTEILFFYNKGDDALVESEIEKTWGMLKFKS
jgi:hypothetical protein